MSFFFGGVAAGFKLPPAGATGTFGLLFGFIAGIIDIAATCDQETARSMIIGLTLFTMLSAGLLALVTSAFVLSGGAALFLFSIVFALLNRFISSSLALNGCE